MALAAAAVGVAGALAAALLTQRQADRAGRDDRRREREARGADLRRQCYVRVYAAARSCRRAQVDHLHARRGEDDPGVTRREPDGARAAQSDATAEAALIAGPDVCRAARETAHRLHAPNGRILKAGRGDAGALDALSADYKAVWVQLDNLREVMQKEVMAPRPGPGR
ncbi:hypothetical protein [Kitasatospora sp. NPDC057198]|uniref:hypothetical protein n=1 Tax=Kitasatospora sp. NPDC057198 TaxID=3346046 RepID=UPI00363664C9